MPENVASRHWWISGRGEVKIPGQVVSSVETSGGLLPHHQGVWQMFVNRWPCCILVLETGKDKKRGMKRSYVHCC